MHRLVALLCITFTLTTAASARIRNPAERHYARGCNRGHVLDCIHRAALHYRQSYSYLASVAWCESRYNPGATNGQYAGLYQFGLNAWYRSGYGRYSRFSAKWSSLAAAHMFAIGHASEWSCA